MQGARCRTSMQMLYFFPITYVTICTCYFLFILPHFEFVFVFLLHGAKSEQLSFSYLLTSVSCKHICFCCCRLYDYDCYGSKSWHSNLEFRETFKTLFHIKLIAIEMSSCWSGIQLEDIGYDKEKAILELIWIIFHDSAIRIGLNLIYVPLEILFNCVVTL